MNLTLKREKIIITVLSPVDVVIIDILIFSFRLEECLELLINTGRIPEAAFFARTYLPSQISR